MTTLEASFAATLLVTKACSVAGCRAGFCCGWAGILAVMEEAQPKLRWYRLTPDRLVLLLLVGECLLWLSDRLGWPTWHKGYAVLTMMAMVGSGILAMAVWFVVALVFRRRFQFSIRNAADNGHRGRSAV